MGATAGVDKRRDRLPNQVEFASIDQFPFDGFPGFHANGGGYRQGQIDIEAGLLALGADNGVCRQSSIAVPVVDRELFRVSVDKVRLQQTLKSAARGS